MTNAFETISEEMMDAVSGGAGSGHPVTAPSGSASNDQLLSSLTGIQSSLNDLSRNRNQGGFLSGTNGLMFMTMAIAASRRPQTTVVYGGHGGYYWQTGW